MESTLSTMQIETTLTSKGYQSLQKVAKALQGGIWKGSKDGTLAIIKVINKSLHDAKITYHNQKAVEVDENIVKESHILKYLSSDKNPPLSLTKFVDFFSDQHYFYLVMEHSGTNLFHFVKQCHECIQNGVLSVSVWQSFCKTAMQQMVALIHWMHTKMNVCHLDISLENFLITNIKVSVDATTKQILNFNPNFQIKIIDFGLSEIFTANNFQCTKFVGKPSYKSPEIFAKKGSFDARSSDCWSLCVTFFKMMIGSPPFEQPFVEDVLFQLIMNKQIHAVLQSWNRMHYVTNDMLDLIQKVFVYETDRLNIEEIQQHSYLSN